MGVAGDIVRTYRMPGRVLAERAAMRSEPRALATLMGGAGLMFVSLWPVLARMAAEDPSIPLPARLAGALFVWLFLAPPVFYALAALGHLIGRVLGGCATGFEARMALFWAFLASMPLWLLSGLVGGLAAGAAAHKLASAVAAGVFLCFWSLGLWQMERKDAP